MQAIDNCVWFDIWKKTWKQWQRGVTRLCILRHLLLNKRIFEVKIHLILQEIETCLKFYQHQINTLLDFISWLWMTSAAQVVWFFFLMALWRTQA